MGAAMTNGTAIKTNNGLAITFARQRGAFLCDGPPSLARRRSDLMKLKDAIWTHREDFIAARMGPNISSRITFISSVTLSTTVGTIVRGCVMPQDWAGLATSITRALLLRASSSRLVSRA